tara:strand:- start:5866 stop:6021 length:156 start_codon:yes stop_codon:yes gene_type:complete
VLVLGVAGASSGIRSAGVTAFFYSWAGLPMSDIFFSKKFLQPEEIYKGQDN